VDVNVREGRVFNDGGDEPDKPVGVLSASYGAALAGVLPAGFVAVPNFLFAADLPEVPNSLTELGLKVEHAWLFVKANASLR
jgi:hypothetical protein